MSSAIIFFAILGVIFAIAIAVFFGFFCFLWILSRVMGPDLLRSEVSRWEHDDIESATSRSVGSDQVS